MTVAGTCAARPSPGHVPDQHVLSLAHGESREGVLALFGLEARILQPARLTAGATRSSNRRRVPASQGPSRETMPPLKALPTSSSRSTRTVAQPEGGAAGRRPSRASSRSLRPGARATRARSRTARGSSRDSPWRESRAARRTDWAGRGRGTSRAAQCRSRSESRRTPARRAGSMRRADPARACIGAAPGSVAMTRP